MKPEDLTKEQVEEMSGEEVKFWCQQFAEQEQVAKLRQHMLNQVEIHEASGPRILHVESEVVENS